MSLTSRARAIEARSGLSYQRSLELIRALGERPAQLSRQLAWSLSESDQYLLGLEPGGDTVGLQVCKCARCSQPFLGRIEANGLAPDSCNWCDEFSAYPPTIARTDIGWEACSTMYPGEVGRAATRTAALHEVRSLEVMRFGGDYEDYGSHDD
jgi:hypothetical protein